ncbi:hypothetical protein ACH42_00060 [Endozoicomonas sp. (ex Bugula neritina AB1)]|nr:hypothetical protein ACH42_00060 [Endozoicomonas sp. (ex Bugula neritina AB1)]
MPDKQPARAVIKTVFFISDTYQQAMERAKKDIRTVFFDEKTGIQALKSLAEGKQVKPGHIGKREFEYIHNGIKVLLEGMDIITGKITPDILKLDFYYCSKPTCTATLFRMLSCTE